MALNPEVLKTVKVAIREYQTYMEREVRIHLRQRAELIDLLRDVHDDDPCHLDHHGNCQAHSWFYDTECAQARIAALLKEVDSETD